jgi:hypothetical protein
MGGKLIFVGDNTNPVLKIDSRAFYGCYSFEAIEINGFLRINDETIGSDAFGSWRYGGTISYVEQAGGILVGTNVLGYFNNAGLSGQD